jgi:hypothetical protein
VTYLLNDIYKDYIEEYDDSIDFKDFRGMCSDFNILIMDHLLDGGKFNMKNNLSTISIARVERDNSKPTIDWGESNQYKKELLDEGVKLYNKSTKEGTKWHIYYTDKDYYRYYWNKGKCTIPNKSVYKFIPTRGIKGNKEKLTYLLKSDDLAYLKFKNN